MKSKDYRAISEFIERPLVRPNPTSHYQGSHGLLSDALILATSAVCTLAIAGTCYGIYRFVLAIV